MMRDCNLIRLEGEYHYFFFLLIQQEMRKSDQSEKKVYRQTVVKLSMMLNG